MFFNFRKIIFYRQIEIIESDKAKIILTKISVNFKNFKLPNLISLRFIKDNNFYIHYYLKILFSLENICSSLKYLDLSNTGLKDNGILRINKNISKIKNIEIINLENNLLTLKCKKYLDNLKILNIQIKLNENKLCLPIQDKYIISLGGSTISGKTSYSCYLNDQTFDETRNSTIGCEFLSVNPSFNKNIKVMLYDTTRWNGPYDALIPVFLFKADGVLLLFDSSNKIDFDELKDCLNIITNFYELEDFPVLLIANKIDLGKVVKNEEIEKFQKENQLIGYFEVSSKTGFNVIESFDYLVEYIIKKEKEERNILQKYFK